LLSSEKDIKIELLALAEQARTKGIHVIVIDTEVVNKSFIQMQLGYCRDIASYSGGKYYPIADLTPQTVHDIVIQEQERSVLSDLQAVLG
jgi:magnesium chelatase subunit D